MVKLLKKLLSFLKSNWSYVGIFIIWLALYVTNFTPGTYLSGWDSLQTELNPLLAVKRALFASWQEYQGLGLAAGMGHAADLPRTIILYFASWVIPQEIIRYTFHMTMFLVAGFGAIKLFKAARLGGDHNQLIPFLGALFYVFNFYVIELMALPFESFSVFFAALPWEIWAFLRLLTRGKLKKSNWLIAALVFLLAAPQAVALQLFAVLMVILGLLALGRVISTRSTIVIKRAIFAVFLILMMNSFWILPQVYFLKTASSVVTTAKANQLSTEDILYRNRDKGNLKDFLTSTGFFYDAVDSNQKQVFAGWKAHRESILVTVILFIIAAITFLGMLRSSKYRIPFLIAYILILIALLNNVFPLDALNAFIRKNMLINQIFRSPFTKFGIPAALITAYFAAVGAAFFFEQVQKRIKNSELRIKNLIACSLIVILSAAVLWTTWPAFTGQYFASNMKVAIAKPYLSAIEYFKTVDRNRRIGLLPEYTHWGWYNTKWGYDGSGFLWYGIEQPIISRTFDVWSAPSETYFWELKHAIEAENIDELTRVVQKYGVSYLLLDHSLYPLVTSAKALSYDKIEEMLSKSENIKLAKKWDFLSLYEVKTTKPVMNFIWGIDNLPNIGPAITTTNYDAAYQNQSDYTTVVNKPYDTYYPFLDITSQTRTDDAAWQIHETDSGWSILRKLPDNIDENYLVPLSGDTQVQLYSGGKSVEYIMPYTVTFRDHVVSVNFPKVPIDLFRGSEARAEPCINSGGKFVTKKERGSLIIESTGGNYGCVYFEDEELPQKYGYLVKVSTKNISGQRLFFYIRDKTKEQSYIEDRLTADREVYVLGQRFDYGLGYSFAFQNNSFKTIPSKNILEGVDVYFMPYDLIKNMFIKNPNFVGTPPAYRTIEAKKENYFLYTVSLASDKKPKIIVLDQAYQPGWVAYDVNGLNFMTKSFPFLAGQEIKNHILVNNWANGWQIEQSTPIRSGSNVKGQTSIVILYWPQYLEYAGFGLAGIMIIYLLIPKRKVKHALHHSQDSVL